MMGVEQTPQQEVLPSIIPFFDEEETRQKRLRLEIPTMSNEEKESRAVAQVSLELYHKEKGERYEFETIGPLDGFFLVDEPRSVLHANFRAKNQVDGSSELFFAEVKVHSRGIGMDALSCCIIGPDDIGSCMYCDAVSVRVRHPVKSSSYSYGRADQP
ncbi:hypothetical protein LINPERHAP1_LOCUS24856 [Linum perenne]